MLLYYFSLIKSSAQTLRGAVDNVSTHTKIVVARWLAESKGEFCETNGATKRTGAGVTILGHAGMISYGVASPKSGSAASGPVLYRRKGKSVTFSLLLHSPSGCPSVSSTDDCGGNVDGVIDQPHEALAQCWKAVFRDATSSAPLAHLYRVSFDSALALPFLNIRTPGGPVTVACPTLRMKSTFFERSQSSNVRNET